MHVACLLWQPLFFAFEGGARTERVTTEKTTKGLGKRRELKWMVGGSRWGLTVLSRGELMRACRCRKCVCMCDSLLSVRKMKRSVWPGAQREERRRGSPNDGSDVKEIRRNRDVLEAAEASGLQDV